MKAAISSTALNTVQVAAGAIGDVLQVNWSVQQSSVAGVDAGLVGIRPLSSTCTGVTRPGSSLGEIARSDFEELLDSSPGLREKTWGTLARRLFEDVLRSTPEYQHLEHGARLGWFEAGRKLELAAGERLEEQGLRFLAVGRVESESSSYTGPCFLPEGETFSALEHCWVAVLPPLQRPIPSAFEELKS